MAEKTISKQIEDESKLNSSSNTDAGSYNRYTVNDERTGSSIGELRKEMVQNRRLGDDWHHKLQQEVKDPKREFKQVRILKIYHKEPEPFSILSLELKTGIRRLFLLILSMS